MENHTAKHFVLQLGSLASLYLSLGFFLVLVFGFITIRFPDVVDNIWEIERAASSIRLGFAMVIVFFPTYITLTRLVNKNRRQHTEAKYLGLTKWLIYLSLLAGGAVLLGDLVAVIMGFLEGELTVRFILKALAVFVVTALAFSYYILDARGYWIKNKKHSLAYAMFASAVIGTMLIASLAYIQTPAEVREQRIDDQMVDDLRDMQWRIESHYRSNKELPADLQTLFGEFEVPKAPEGREAYQYQVIDEKAYELCATFAQDSDTVVSKYAHDRVSVAAGFPGNYNWDYKAGEWCFARTVESEEY